MSEEVRIIDGVPVNPERIIDALKIIKQVCMDNLDSYDCKNTCPFVIEGVCGITDETPCDWNILEPQKFQALR